MKGMQPAKCNKFYIGIYQYLSEIYILFIYGAGDVLGKSLSCNFKNGMFNYEYFLYMRMGIFIH